MIVEIELNGAERAMFEKSAQAVKAWSKPARRLLRSRQVMSDLARMSSRFGRSAGTAVTEAA